ncbi:MAG TPA: hypothetical protein VEU96_15145 [Bryobacteraceae bacterium]|nr:hypothetical protein [Bryobacteraceae bacterium]
MPASKMWGGPPGPRPTPSSASVFPVTEQPDQGARRGRGRPPHFESSSYRAILFFLALSLPLILSADERWKMQFNYDKADSTLNIRDLQCPSAQRCIAAGVIFDKKGHGQGAVVVSSDGGQKWATVDVKEEPISLFFLNDSTGWMVTDKGLWSTSESGRSWKKMEGWKKGIVRVHFRDPLHGYAIGFPKIVRETTDGGKNWTKLAEAAKPTTDAERTVYDCIAFLGNHGLITGRVTPFSLEETPIWMDPNTARYRRERQSPTILLETLDGGQHWDSTTSSIFGHITQLRLTKEGTALALVEYEDYYALPSTIYTIRFDNTRAGKVFAESDRAVRDVILLPSGRTILAAVEPTGRSNQVPIPGKLKMLESNNLKVWTEMDVDYRAVAQRAILAAPDDHHVWVATDTGMILQLVDTANTPK